MGLRLGLGFGLVQRTDEVVRVVERDELLDLVRGRVRGKG